MQWWVCYASKTLGNILQNIECVVSHITAQREKRSQPVLFLQILKSCRLICALKQSIPPTPLPQWKTRCQHACRAQKVCLSNILIMESICGIPACVSQTSPYSVKHHLFLFRVTGVLDIKQAGIHPGRVTYTHCYDTHKHGDIKHTFAHKHLKCLLWGSGVVSIVFGCIPAGLERCSPPEKLHI